MGDQREPAGSFLRGIKFLKESVDYVKRKAYTVKVESKGAISQDMAPFFVPHFKGREIRIKEWLQ